MQVGTGNEQVNQYIQTYIENQSLLEDPSRRRVTVGRPPRQAPAVQPRDDAEADTRLVTDAERVAQSITDTAGKSYMYEPLAQVAGRWR